MQIEEDAFKHLIQFCQKNDISRRSLMKIARISRVIANLDKYITITKPHMFEAIRYKVHLF